MRRRDVVLHEYRGLTRFHPLDERPLFTVGSLKGLFVRFGEPHEPYAPEDVVARRLHLPSRGILA